MAAQAYSHREHSHPAAHANMTVDGLILSLDQGTQSTRASLFSATGQLLGQSQIPVALHARDAQHIEQDGNEIIASLIDTTSELFKQTGAPKTAIAAAGLATQRSSVAAWDRSTGKPLSPILSWQDTRGESLVQTLATQAKSIHARSGLPLSAHYGASKIRWLAEFLANQNLTDASQICIGPIASFCLANLLAGTPAVVDCANAQRTQLMDLNTQTWSPALLQTFWVDQDLLPRIVPTRCDFGRLHGDATTMRAVNGDQTAALFASGMPDPTTVRVNLGTGGFVLRCCDHLTWLPNLLTGIADQIAEQVIYTLEGTLNGCGAAINWALDRLGLPNQPIDELQAGNSTDLVFLNTVSGLGSPWWHRRIEPHWVDLQGQRVEHPDSDTAIPAVVESVVFLIQANLERLQSVPPELQTIEISGGLAQCDALCQHLANLSHLTVKRSNDPEATSRGIAWLAANGPTDWAQPEHKVFSPKTDAALCGRYNVFRHVIDAL